MRTPHETCQCCRGLGSIEIDRTSTVTIHAICATRQPNLERIAAITNLPERELPPILEGLKRKGFIRENGMSVNQQDIWRLTEMGITELLPLAGCRECGHRPEWREHADSFRIVHGSPSECKATCVIIDMNASPEQLAERWNQHYSVHRKQKA